MAYEISKDLEWLARNVSEWPDDEDAYLIGLDPDGEVRWGPDTVSHDFYPNDPPKDLVARCFLLSGNEGHTRMEWELARHILNCASDGE